MCPVRVLLGVCLLGALSACSGSSDAAAPATVADATTPPIELDLTPVTEGDPSSGPVTADAANTTTAIPIRTAPPITDPRVFMVGDSVLAATAIGQPDALDRNVARLGWAITVDARVSRFTDEGRRVVERRADEIGQVLVVVLGHNYDGDEEAYRSDLRAIFDAAPDVQLIVIVTVPLHEPIQAEVNRVIVEEAVRDPRILVADWETVTRTFEVLSGDDLHPTASGAEVLAQLIGITLGRAPGGDPAEPLPVLGEVSSPALAPGVAGDKGENSPSIGSSPTTVATATSPGSTTRPSGTTTTGPAVTDPPTTAEPDGSSGEVTTAPTSPPPPTTPTTE